MRPRYLLVLSALVVLGACARPRPVSDNNDFSITAQSQQQVALDGIRQVVLRCYCFRRRVVEVTGLPQIEIASTTTYDSVGYHGQQDKPKTIDDAALHFIERREGDTLILESRERTYMHHAFLLNDLEVRIPAGLPHTVEQITREQLEGRRPDAAE